MCFLRNALPALNCPKPHACGAAIKSSWLASDYQIIFDNPSLRAVFQKRGLAVSPKS
ncbi:unnamed protein product [Ectocarpus sp. 4 AP-2014]